MRLVGLTVGTAVAMACCFVALSSRSSSGPTELLSRAAPTQLFQKNSWKALTPDGVEGADIRESRNSDRASQKAAVRDEDRKLNIFFGIQHFKRREFGIEKDTGAQDLSAAGGRTTQLDGLPGYMDPTSYLQKLQNNAVAGQTSYMKNWAHKNRVAALGAVKDAAKRYKKWMLISPTTGRAPLNLHIPHDTEEDAVARRPGMARQQALMDVTADNGQSYTLPWCASSPLPRFPTHASNLTHNATSVAISRSYWPPKIR